tara:strand:+ start:887 stop:1315 length:429 start_codon:yes stop_codon:yes gene_type:complete
MIKTPGGDKLIETLKIGDLISDKSMNNTLEIKSIINRNCETDDLYVLRKNKLGREYPSKDLFISGNHFIEHDSKIYLPSISKLFKRCPKNMVTYFHIETEDYINDWMIANNIVVETYSNKYELNLDEGIRRLSKAIQSEKNR